MGNHKGKECDYRNQIVRLGKGFPEQAARFVLN